MDIDTCPHCGADVSFAALHSVFAGNADYDAFTFECVSCKQAIHVEVDLVPAFSLSIKK